MKRLYVLLGCLVATTAFAAPQETHLPKFARVSQHTLKLAKPVMAQLSCDLYQFDEYYNPTFLANQNSPIFNVGVPTSIAVNFPAPYDEFSVRFDHYSVEWAIDNFSTVRPLISAAIIKDTKYVSNYQATFAIENAKTGSKITLDPGYKVSDNLMLYSACSITFIK